VSDKTGINDVAKAVLNDLPVSSVRDQNAAIVRDRLKDFGVTPTPAAVRGVLVGILIIREQMQRAYGQPGSLGVLIDQGDLFNIPEVLAGMEGAAAMIDLHTRSGR
jgi:hypothetical protein